MSQRRTVAVAYVTKWATTRGIVVVKEAEEYVSDDGVRYLSKKGQYGGIFVSPKDWTEDKAEAERRWRKAMEKERARLVKKQAALAQALKDGPKWEET